MSDEHHDERDELRHRFMYHRPPTEGIAEAHTAVRAHLMVVAETLAELLPDGREKALTMTKLEEAMFWANAAIARDPEGVGE